MQTTHPRPGSRVPDPWPAVRGAGGGAEATSGARSVAPSLPGRRLVRARRSGPAPVVLLAVLSLVGPSLPGAVPGLGAQEVTGRIVDGASGRSVPQAIVEVFDGEGEKVGVTLADDEGSFGVRLVRPGGPLRVVVWAMSYERATVESVHVAAGETADVGEVRLEPSPIPISMEPVEVEAGGLPRGRELVRKRQLLGRGTFLSGAVIEQDDPLSLTHYLADAAGLMARYSVSAHRTRAADPTRSRTPFILQQRPPPVLKTIPFLYSPEAPNDCMRVTINHWPMEASGYASLDEIRLEWIAAVEIYNTPRDIPEESTVGMVEPRIYGCGLANIWLWNSW